MAHSRALEQARDRVVRTESAKYPGSLRAADRPSL